MAEDTTVVKMINCPKCGQYKIADTYSQHICVDCAKAENNRYCYSRTHNDTWMAAAKENGVDLWVQQPGETQWEYTVWTAFRDAYPGKKPTYGDVARQLNTTIAAVKHIAVRWSFQARMQAWILECDRITLAQRRSEILDMNADHINMSKKLREKLNVAIDLVEPQSLEPKDIVALAKLATDMERKAQTDTLEQTEARGALMRDQELDNPELKKSATAAGDLGEVVKILMQAGVLGDITHVGVRKTTEVLVGDAAGNTNVLTQEE